MESLKKKSCLSPVGFFRLCLFRESFTAQLFFPDMIDCVMADYLFIVDFAGRMGLMRLTKVFPDVKVVVCTIVADYEERVCYIHSAIVFRTSVQSSKFSDSDYPYKAMSTRS